jgi:hypothetical protein
MVILPGPEYSCTTGYPMAHIEIRIFGKQYDKPGVIISGLLIAGFLQQHNIKY